MGYDPACPVRNRLAVDFVEADVEIGFNLVDLAGQELQCGQAAVATRVLHDADDVLLDIERRLLRLESGDRASFQPLFAELRRAVSAAKRRTSSSSA